MNNYLSQRHKDTEKEEWENFVSFSVPLFASKRCLRESFFRVLLILLLNVLTAFSQEDARGDGAMAVRYAQWAKTTI
ncbi:MAG: hypothetical protein LBH42_07140, partial [Treponema sp.]|nr:hypothetical protein [Treponema sp.]